MKAHIQPSEGKDGCPLLLPEQVDEETGEEKTQSDTDTDLDHTSSNLETGAEVISVGPTIRIGKTTSCR
jgi:hypothetical protein